MSRKIASVWYELDAHDLRLLEELHFLTGDRQYCFPSRAYLAAKLGISIWCVSRHSAKLRRLGLLRIQARRYRRADGTWETRSNLYQVLGFIGRKIRALLTALTGVRPHKCRPKPKEKSLSSDLSHVKNPELRTFLERWKARGQP